jgi:hypothetical protein
VAGVTVLSEIFGEVREGQATPKNALKWKACFKGSERKIWLGVGGWVGESDLKCTPKVHFEGLYKKILMRLLDR